MFCTCGCASPTLLFQLIKAFQQSCLAACHLLFDSFLLAGQAASTQRNILLSLNWNKMLELIQLTIIGSDMFLYRYIYIFVHLHKLTCQRWPLPQGQWGGWWSRQPGQWVYVQLGPSHPIWSHCSGAECTSPRAKSAPAHVQKSQSVICYWTQIYLNLKQWH